MDCILCTNRAIAGDDVCKSCKANVRQSRIAAAYRAWEVSTRTKAQREADERAYGAPVKDIATVEA